MNESTVAVFLKQFHGCSSKKINPESYLIRITDANIGRQLDRSASPEEIRRQVFTYVLKGTLT